MSKKEEGLSRFFNRKGQVQVAAVAAERAAASRGAAASKGAGSSGAASGSGGVGKLASDAKSMFGQVMPSGGQKEKTNEKKDSESKKSRGWVSTAGVAASKRTVKEGVDAVKDPGFVLLVGGGLAFIVQMILVNVPVFYIVVSSFFMLYAASELFEKKGLVTVIAGWVWYIGLGGMADIGGLTKAFLPIVMVGLLIHVLINKVGKRGSIGEAVTGELLFGVGLFLLFILDLGIVPYLSSLGFALPDITERALQLIPVWGLLGLMTTKKKNFFIGAAKFVGIAYIMIIVIFSSPDLFADTTDTITGADKLVGAKRDALKADTRENPAITFSYCLFSKEYKITQMSACQQKRAIEQQFSSACLTQGFEKGTPEYDGCIQEEERLAREGASVKGNKDKYIREATRATLKINKDDLLGHYDEGVPFPVELKVENPREMALKVEITCKFIGKGSLKDVDGDLQGHGSAEFSDKNPELSFHCYPASKMEEGTYEMQVNATFSQLETKSHITRIFVRDELNTKQKKDVLKDVKQQGHSITSTASQDFARFNFYIGHTKTDPLIEMNGRKLITMASNVENLGKGHVSLINSYSIDLKGMSVAKSQRCRAGGNIKIQNSKKKKHVLGICTLDGQPYDYFSDLPWSPVVFEATLQYEYALSTKETVKIAKSPYDET